jgi:hypothetical protein
MRKFRKFIRTNQVRKLLRITVFGLLLFNDKPRYHSISVFTI